MLEFSVLIISFAICCACKLTAIVWLFSFIVV